MSRSKCRSLVALGCLGIGMLLPAAAEAQINNLNVDPSTACVGDMVTVEASGGMVSCTDVRVRADDGGGTVITSVPQTGALPLEFSFTFDDPGTYELTLEPPPPDCVVLLPGQVAVQVNRCLVAGHHEDAGFTEIQRRFVATVDDLTIKARPTITKGFGGKLQPGNPASFFLGGKHFPRSDAEGDAYIAISGTWIRLLPEQWDSAGNAVAVRVPDSITGVMDQQTVVRIVTQDGMVSNDWPVEFRAARETRTLTQNELEVVECSDSSNVDHCNDVSHVDSINWFCGANGNASYSGCHYNTTSFADVGFDRYRIELKNGWVINTILFSAEGGSVSRTSGNPVDHTSWVEEIAWSAGRFEMAQYSGFVSIIGPRGIPHK